MSNLGMRIEASGFEVGFKAETREEFDSYLARLTLVAATIWPASAAAQRGIGDDEPIPEPNDLGVDYRNVTGGGHYAEQRKVATDWREGQGLR